MGNEFLPAMTLDSVLSRLLTAELETVNFMFMYCLDMVDVFMATKIRK